MMTLASRPEVILHARLKRHSRNIASAKSKIPKRLELPLRI